jgi:restriction system protein
VLLLQNVYRCFINSYKLLALDSTDTYRLLDKGKSFLNNDIHLIRKIDQREGLTKVLSVLAANDQAKLSDLLPEWEEFLLEHSKITTETNFRDTLRTRLYNLVDRGLVKRDGQVFSITPLGADYASGLDKDPKHNVLRTITSHNEKQKKILRERIEQMNPYLFEHLIGDLLDAMGYSDVRVTKPSGDKGVDVVATVEFGITTITEVVQVKRHKSSIGREVLDQLRGVLPLHGALRGSLISIGNFSKGCKEVAIYPGAAPISLIDGDKLIDLLFLYEIGVKKSEITFVEINEDYFTGSQESEQAVDEGINV